MKEIVVLGVEHDAGEEDATVEARAGGSEAMKSHGMD